MRDRVIRLIMGHEEALSDGYEFYCADVGTTVARLADRILEVTAAPAMLAACNAAVEWFVEYGTFSVNPGSAEATTVRQLVAAIAKAKGVTP